MLPRLPISTLFPYTTLFRSGFDGDALIAGREQRFHQRSRVFDERDQIDGAGRKLSALDRGLEDLAHPRNVPSEQLEDLSCAQTVVVLDLEERVDALDDGRKGSAQIVSRLMKVGQRRYIWSRGQSGIADRLARPHP